MRREGTDAARDRVIRELVERRLPHRVHGPVGLVVTADPPLHGLSRNACGYLDRVVREPQSCAAGHERVQHFRALALDCRVVLAAVGKDQDGVGVVERSVVIGASAVAFLRRPSAVVDLDVDPRKPRQRLLQQQTSGAELMPRARAVPDASQRLREERSPCPCGPTVRRPASRERHARLDGRPR